MAANINSNFPSINLIPSSIQGAAKQQQIQALTNQVKGNEGKIAKIDKEIIAREKIIEAAETKKDVCIEAMQNCQNIIKVCNESKEITNQIISNNEKMISNNEKMIGIYETLMARNNLQQVNSLGNENQNSTTTQIVFADIAYNPPKIDFSKYDTKPIEPQKTTKSFNQITKDYKPRNYSSSVFNDWFGGLKSHSMRFFKWF